MSTNRLTRGPKQLFGATAVLAALVVPPALATSSAGAAPLATATVQIDGTSLSTTSLDIHNPDGTTTETVPTTSVQTLTLQEGTYSFDAGASAFACNPSLTTAGTWSIPSSCGAAWSGNGTTTLVLRGLPLTLDAAALSTGIEPLMYGLPAIPAGGSATFTLMPEGSEMVVGSGEDTSCGPGLAPDGAATVNGCGASAEVSGSEIIFKGFKVSVNGQSLSTSQYFFIDALTLDGTAQESATTNAYALLPAYYDFSVDGTQTNFAWDLGTNGRISYVTADKKFLGGGGSTALVVKGLPVSVDATSLGAGTFTLGGIAGGPFEQSSPQALRLVPGAYGFATSASAPPEFGWSLSTKDAVELAKGNSCAYAAGSTLTVDCSPPTVTEVSGSPNPVTQGSPFTVTALECDRVADVDATGTITIVDVTTHDDLGTFALSPATDYVNCGEAQVSDTESLKPGTYTFKATYHQGGTIPVPNSAPATYHQKVVGPD